MILDNFSSHHAAEVKQAAKAHAIALVFLAAAKEVEVKELATRS